MEVIFRSCFFYIDKVVFGLISRIYELLMVIARVSPLSQTDIAIMAERIYGFLTIFMIFKVTFSLIMYVVNPDDFTEKSKGISKLTINIIISLALLILTPYIFNMAFELQTIILEDNALATLIFGDEQSSNENKKFLVTGGDTLAFIAASPFITPNTSINGLEECITVVVRENNSNDVLVNPECSGLDNETMQSLGKGLAALSEDKSTVHNNSYSLKTIQNYVAGVNNQNLGLFLREDLIKARTSDDVFLMEYKFIFSTAVAIVLVLLLITYCMDIAVRSIKLAFLQLIAPVPIISYVDPKSGKDGLFKKWYKMCFSTYTSLFVRLLVIYFAIYIISKVADMQLIDVVDGSYVTGGFLQIFIVIGTLMFAKQLPKMLEGLGIKLDGDGKFTLNPLKKIEEGALGGGILKKPNAALAKAGRAVLMSPISGASLLGKKAIGAIDSKRNGGTFRTGWNNTHGKLHNNFYKKLDEWAPMNAEARKNRIKGERNQEQRVLRERVGQPMATSVNNDLDRLARVQPKKYSNLNEWKEDDFASYARAKLQAELSHFKNAEYRESYRRLGELKIDETLKKNKAQELSDYYQAVMNGQTITINGKTYDQSNASELLKLRENASAAAASASGKVENAKKRHEDVKLKYGADANLESAYDEYGKGNKWVPGASGSGGHWE